LGTTIDFHESKTPSMRRNKYFAAVLIALMVAVIILWQKPQSSKNVESIVETNTTDAVSMNSLSTNSASKTNQISAHSVVPPPTGLAPIQNDREKTNAIQRYMESQNKPIEFYGQIIDQNSTPITGVEIKIKVRHWDVVAPTAWGADARIIPIETETDLSGRFEIRHVTGDVFDVESIKKTGYVLSPKTPNSFGPSTGSLQNPVTIKMWKLGEPGKVILKKVFWDLAPDGQPCTIDLVSDTKSNGENTSGDLVVKLSRPANIQPHDRYSWTIVLSAVDGGLAETQDEFLYSAPEAGYLPTITIGMNPERSDWTSVLKKDFYISSRSGTVFGALHFTIRPNYGEASAIQIEAILNANGSRNLQP
jgi:hypothetical protein